MLFKKKWDKEGEKEGSRYWGVGSFTENMTSEQEPAQGETVLYIYSIYPT